jgi:hypothetical protein
MQNIKIGYGGGGFDIKQGHLNLVERKASKAQKARAIAIQLVKWLSFGIGFVVFITGWLMVSAGHLLIGWTQK